jgi:mxaJ protein
MLLTMRTASPSRTPRRRRPVSAAVLFAVGLTLAAGCGRGQPQPFRVCADPNNLPFSNEARQGFENRLAELVADELHTTVEYTWWAQRRGFVRHTLGAGACDAVMGVPARFEPTLQTRHYYRSSYVFVTRATRHLEVRSFDDDALRHLRVGVHTAGDDFGTLPPGHALARRNIVQNVVGYSLYGDYAAPNPPARLVEAVAAGEVDVAVVWGPFGGYFARQQPQPLTVTAVTPEQDDPATPFAFDIAIGVRRGNEELRDRLNVVLDRRREEINRLLDSYGIPRVDPAARASR